MHLHAGLALAVAAATVSASPIERQVQGVTLPLTHVNNAQTMKSIVDSGKARIQAMNDKGLSKISERQSSGSITNEDVSYVAPVSIGGRTYQLIVDTGSSNTWCGAQGACEKSSTGKDTGHSVSVSYGSGSFSGEEYTDKVSFGGLTVTSQSIGAATTSNGFAGVDGIVGFGPTDLTQGTVSGVSTVPTLMDNLYKQRSIPTEVLGVYFKPEAGSDSGDTNGELTLGGTDSTKYSGSISYFPRLTSGAFAPYWGLSIAKLGYGSTTLQSNLQGIIDTGTTLIYIPSTAYSKFLSASGGRTDSASGLASFTTKPTQNFNIQFGSSTFSLTPAQYLVPTAQYSNFGLSSGKYYAWINSGGSSGVNCIIGQKFLENYYSAFDTTNSRVGFATRT